MRIHRGQHTRGGTASAGTEGASTSEHIRPERGGGTDHLGRDRAVRNIRARQLREAGRGGEVIDSRLRVVDVQRGRHIVQAENAVPHVANVAHVEHHPSRQFALDGKVQGGRVRCLDRLIDAVGDGFTGRCSGGRLHGICRRRSHRKTRIAKRYRVHAGNTRRRQTRAARIGSRITWVGIAYGQGTGGVGLLAGEAERSSRVVAHRQRGTKVVVIHAGSGADDSSVVAGELLEPAPVRVWGPGKSKPWSEVLGLRGVESSATVVRAGWLEGDGRDRVVRLTRQHGGAPLVEPAADVDVGRYFLPCGLGDRRHELVVEAEAESQVLTKLPRVLHKQVVSIGRPMTNHRIALRHGIG